MVRKILISFCMSLIFSLNAFSATADIHQLVNNYQYDMTVVWNQVDQDFYTERTKLFSEQINVALDNHKISKADILTFIQEKAPDANILESLEVVISKANKDMTNEDIILLLKENADHLYGRGASWEGSSPAFEIALIFMIAGLFMIPLTFKNAK